jgi:para-nitrobenzyl esterase
LRIEGGAVRGAAVSGLYQFLGLPYAAPPTGELRWRPPRPPRVWDGVRDATEFGPSCPQPASLFAPPAPFSEDCLYLNIYTSTLHRDGDRPVLVWIHGGGFTEDGARNYDGSKLAADGIVVVTINYRLGALGFLAHPALASRPGGPAGNYGLMDQQAALRWVKHNIRQFGGNPNDVTIAGQSAGGVSVLAQMVSRGSRGLFGRAIVESGAFALTQQPLAQAEAFGETFAAKVGCRNQTADCLRHVPVADLVNPNNFPSAAIPGVIDGKVLTESIGTALAEGRFARGPILNGINHNEEWIFTAGLGLAVSGGRFVPVPEPVTDENSYQADIAAVLGVSPERAATVAAEYPLSTYPAPILAFTTLVSDANFACPGTAGRPLDLEARAHLRLSIQRRQRAVAIRRPQAAPDRHALLRVPVPVRPAQHAVPRHAQSRPADPRRHHAHGVGELRSRRRPMNASVGLAVVQPRSGGDVPCTPAAADLDRVLRRTPLLLLGGRIGGHRRRRHSTMAVGFPTRCSTA